MDEASLHKVRYKFTMVSNIHMQSISQLLRKISLDFLRLVCSPLLHGGDDVSLDSKLDEQVQVRPGWDKEESAGREKWQ